MAYQKHILAASGIVRDDAGQILLILHPQRGWEPPGGIIDAGEDVLTGLRREILEETGIIAEPGKLVGMYSNVADPVKFMLTFEAKPVGGSLQTSAESLEVGWFGPEAALDKITHPAQRQKVHDALHLQGIIYRVYRTQPYILLDSTEVSLSER